MLLWYRNPLRIAKHRRAWKNDRVRRFLFLTAMLCFGLLPLTNGAVAYGEQVAATYPGGTGYNGGGVPQGLADAQQFGDSTDLRALLLKALDTVLTFLGVIAVLVIVIAGIYIMVRGEDESTRSKAYKMITYAVIGLILILLAGAIVKFVVGIA